MRILKLYVYTNGKSFQQLGISENLTHEQYISKIPKYNFSSASSVIPFNKFIEVSGWMGGEGELYIPPIEEYIIGEWYEKTLQYNLYLTFYDDNSFEMIADENYYDGTYLISGDSITIQFTDKKIIKYYLWGQSGDYYLAMPYLDEQIQLIRN